MITPLSRRRSWIRIGVAALAMAPFACGGRSDVANQDVAPGASLEDLRAQIIAATDGAACNGTTQCRAVPIGHKACGGPAGYWIYSTLNTDTLRLTDLVRRYTERQREVNAEEGRMSDCRVVTRPVAGCIDGACRAR